MLNHDVPPVRNGIDVLLEDELRPIADARVGLIANGASRTIDGRRTVDALAQADSIMLHRLFVAVPELDAPGPLDLQPPADLQATRIDGADCTLSPDDLDDLDVVLFDVPEPGSRWSPFVAILGDALEACADKNVRIYVLDRPNPLDGVTVEGPCAESGYDSIYAYAALPLRHGMTMGELARLLNSERNFGARLSVVTMAGWQRQYWSVHTGQAWSTPLAGLDDAAAAALYAALGLLADTGLSLREDDAQMFRVLGAPWIDAKRIATKLTAEDLAGLAIGEHSWTDRGVRMHGVRFEIEGVESFSAAELALAAICALRDSSAWDFRKLELRLARPDLLAAIEDKAPELTKLWVPDPDFFEVRAKALLY